MRKPRENPEQASHATPIQGPVPRRCLLADTRARRPTNTQRYSIRGPVPCCESIKWPQSGAHKPRVYPEQAGGATPIRGPVPRRRPLVGATPAIGTSSCRTRVCGGRALQRAGGSGAASDALSRARLCRRCRPSRGARFRFTPSGGSPPAKVRRHCTELEAKVLPARRVESDMVVGGGEVSGDETIPLPQALDEVGELLDQLMRKHHAPAVSLGRSRAAKKARGVSFSKLRFQTPGLGPVEADVRTC